MANRNWSSAGKIYSMHVSPVLIDCRIQIGASGAVTAFSGQTVKSVTRLTTGVYDIQLQDTYKALYSVICHMRSPTSGSAVTAGSFVVGTLYTITTLGTTNYTAIGLAPGLTPAVGLNFVATGVGSGTGTAMAVLTSGIDVIEEINSNSAMLNNSNISFNGGAHILIQTLAATSSSVTTKIPSNPVSGSSIHVTALLNMSSVQ